MKKFKACFKGEEIFFKENETEVILHDEEDKIFIVASEIRPGQMWLVEDKKDKAINKVIVIDTIKEILSFSHTPLDMDIQIKEALKSMDISTEEILNLEEENVIPEVVIPKGAFEAFKPDESTAPVDPKIPSPMTTPMTTRLHTLPVVADKALLTNRVIIALHNGHNDLTTEEVQLVKILLDLGKVSFKKLINLI